MSCKSMGAAVVLVMAAAVCPACDGTSVIVAPSGATLITASLRPPAPVVVFMNVTGPVLQSCDLVIVASSPVSLQQVTLHMIDGSNLGGPTVTVPTPFSTTPMGAGMTRTFPLQLPASSHWPPRSVGASVGFVDGSAVPHHVTAAGACP